MLLYNTGCIDVDEHISRGKRRKKLYNIYKLYLVIRSRDRDRDRDTYHDTVLYHRDLVISSVISVISSLWTFQRSSNRTLTEHIKNLMF